MSKIRFDHSKHEGAAGALHSISELGKVLAENIERHFPKNHPTQARARKLLKTAKILQVELELEWEMRRLLTVSPYVEPLGPFQASNLAMLVHGIKKKFNPWIK